MDRAELNDLILYINRQIKQSFVLFVHGDGGMMTIQDAVRSTLSSHAPTVIYPGAALSAGSGAEAAHYDHQHTFYSDAPAVEVGDVNSAGNSLWYVSRADHVHRLPNLSPSPAGTYGSSTKVPVVVIDAKGRVTSVSEVTISGVAPAAHNILSAAHGDTLADTLVRGDVLYVNATPKLARLAIGGITGSVLTRNATDVLWSTGGLSFGGAYTLTISGNSSINGTAIVGTPGSLTVSTPNATADPHTHAVVSSSNPGAAASLLATNASGYLQLVRLGIGTAPSYPIHVLGNVDSTLNSPVVINQNTGTAAVAAGVWGESIATGKYLSLLVFGTNYGTPSLALSGAFYADTGLTNGIVFQTNAAAPVKFNTSGVNTRFTIDANGYIVHHNLSADISESGANFFKNHSSDWSSHGWKKTVKVGSNSTITTLRFAYNNGYQFGFGVSTDGIFRLLRHNTESNTGAPSYDLYVDTSGTWRFGSTLSSTAGILTVTSSGVTSILGGSDATQFTVQGYTTQTNPVAVITRNDGNTNAVANVLQIGANSTGTAANGFGAGLLWTLESSTTADQSAARIYATWYVATHASRQADLVITAYDTAEREGIRVRGSGSVAMLGFYGVTPVVRPTALTTQLTTLTYTAPGTPDYAIQDLTNSSGYGFVTKDEGNSVLSVIANLQTRVSELETKLQGLGLLT